MYASRFPQDHPLLGIYKGLELIGVRKQDGQITPLQVSLQEGFLFFLVNDIFRFRLGKTL